MANIILRGSIWRDTFDTLDCIVLAVIWDGPVQTHVRYAYLEEIETAPDPKIRQKAVRFFLRDFIESESSKGQCGLCHRPGEGAGNI